MGKTYGYKTGRQTPTLDAQAVGLELERIADFHGGNLKASVVVEESRPKDAVLHGQFEWRDKVAAEKFRIHQARNIINVVTVVVDPPSTTKTKQPLQAFVNVVEGPISDHDLRSYQNVESVLSDPDKRTAMVQRCLEKLVRVRNEFAALQEYAAVWAQIDQMAKDLL